MPGGGGWAGGESLACRGSSRVPACCHTPPSIWVCHSVQCLQAQPSEPLPLRPCPGPSPPLVLDAQPWDCKEEAASKSGSWPGLPLLFIPSVQGRMDQILSVLTAEEEVRVEKEMEGKGVH